MKKMLLFFALIFVSMQLFAIQQPEELMNDINDAERIMTRLKQLNALTSNSEQGLLNSLITNTDEDSLELWVYNFLNNTHSLISVTRQINSTLCNIYVADDIWNVTIDPVDVEHLRNAFEDSTAADPTKGVYELDTVMFGITSDIDNNGKTNILIYDIDDTNINGYFSPSDLLGGPYSNNMELLYIDDNPHNAGIHSSYCYATLAHEFQHLIHCNHDSNETTWVNEGLSSFAQWVNGWISPYWMMLFTQNPDNNLVQWSAGADYPQSYLFMHYLYEHYVIGEENIIYNDLANAIWHSILNFLGEFGASKAEIWLVRNLYDGKKQAGIIRCSHKYLERIRASLSLIDRIGDTRFVVKVLGVSGTIKATQMKYFSETSLTEFT